MKRCIELAKSGAGYVAPNPMVGAVLVHDDRIIGEGFHQIYGQAHAEVNCINSVKEENKHLIPQSILYVSLEPCVHYGKTPPCTDRIILEGIRKVVLGSGDPFENVNGKGINRLKEAGVDVQTGILEKECIDLNRRFFTFHLKYRPYIILKWAQSANAKIACRDYSRVFISNELSNRLVHQWRSEEASILIGTNTARHDDPELTNRLWKGRNPVRLVIDLDLKLPESLKIFNNQGYTIIFNVIKQDQHDNLQFLRIARDSSLVLEIINALYQLNIQSVLVEGGAKLLQSFIDENMWDETRVITNEELTIENGIAAPELSGFIKIRSENILGDKIRFYNFLQ